MGSEKNGNSLNEMKILVVFLEMFRQINGSFFVGTVPTHSIPKTQVLQYGSHCVTETYYYQPDKPVKYCKKA